MRRAVGKGRKAGGKAGLIRAEALGEELAERLTPRALPPICYEHYGPDGEIEEVWGDRHPGTGRAISFYVVTCTDYAPPKEDWRERGVVPPKGWHRRGEESKSRTVEEAETAERPRG